MHFIKGENKDQMQLFPQTIDDYIPKNNIARLINEFIYSLNLQELGFKGAVPGFAGRPSYDPATLLALYIYGYYYRIRSSRALERETYRNFEVIWLINNLHPDDKTICNFRKDNREALKKVFNEFVKCCKDMNLIGGELIAIDGSKFRAVNSKSNNFKEETLTDKIMRIDNNIESFFNQLDNNDNEEKNDYELTSDEIEKKILELQERKKTYEGYREQLKSSGESQLSITDPDSRRMKDNGRIDVCYNVQTSVDSKNKLILAFEVTNEENDLNLLSKVALETKKVLGVEKLDVVADKGYFNGQEIKKCQDNDIIPYVSEPVENSRTKNGIPTPDYYKSKFSYISTDDSKIYVCPCGYELHFASIDNRDGKIWHVYRCKDYDKCAGRTSCTSNKYGRSVKRWEHEKVIEDMRVRNAKNKEKMKQRKCLCEHPFGTVKRGMNQGYFLMKGLLNTAGEAAITFFSYNLKRAVNILGVERLIDEFRKISGRNRQSLAQSRPLAGNLM
jgi:transposase